MKVVLASDNQGKIAEFKEALKDFQIEIISQSELGVSAIEETGLTFIENALLKARHASKQTGLPAIADDSGLVVAALNGQPGIYSARYAGLHATSADNIQKLLDELKGVPEEKRDACFYCALIWLSHDQDPTPLLGEGRLSGTILSQPRGTHGFGYDPIFYIPKEGKSAAQLPLAIKNKISHRGIAIQSLLKKLADQPCTRFPSKI